jgi:hypothetical protein
MNRKLFQKKGTPQNPNTDIATSLKQKLDLPYFIEKSNNIINNQDNIYFIRISFLTQILEKIVGARSPIDSII